MAKQAVSIGPWPDGLNERDDPAEISDTELTSLINLDVEDTGTLIPRRGWEEVSVSGALKLTPLGIYTSQFNNPKAIFAKATNINSGSETTQFFSLDGTALTDVRNASSVVITRPGLFAATFNMNKKIYFVPDWRSGAVGNAFELTNVVDTTPTNVPAIPVGQWAFVMNDRAFVFNPDIGRLYWSKATDPTIWAAPDGGYVDIDPSDNPFTDCVVVRTTAYFLRSDGIYAFTFSSDPGIDGSVSEIANSEGAVRGFAYQNELFLITPRGLFRFVGGYMSLVSDKVTLGVQTGLASTSDYNGVSVIEHTAWIRSWDGVQMSHVAFNLRTGSASRYTQSNLIDIRGKSISDTKYTYLCSTNKVAIMTNQRSKYRTTAGGKSFGYSFQTKRFSFTSRLVFKRIMSWLVDYHSGANFYDGDNGTKFYFKVNAGPGYDYQTYFYGTAIVTNVGSSGRVDTKSARFKDIQFGLQASQMGAVNPTGVGADAGVNVRGIVVYIAGSRELATIQT